MDAEQAIQKATKKKERLDITHNETARRIGIGVRTWRHARNSPDPPSRETLKRILEWVEDDTTEPRPSPQISGVGPSQDLNIEKAKERQKRRFRRKQKTVQKKKRQTIRFDTGPICLFFLGDQHIGNQGTDIDRVFEEQKIIMNTPRAFCWQMGDVVDNFVVGRLKMKNAEPSAPVREQWALAEHYLESFEDRIVAYVGGNHEKWTMSKTTIDYRRDICPDGILYDGDEIQAIVSVGPAEYRIKARHKWPGSSVYNQTHFADRARKEDSRFDVYVGAHDHQGSIYKEMIHEEERKAGVKVGTYKVHDDYALERGFPDHDASTACALILHDDGSFHGMADLNAAKRYMHALH